jgi:hypothetical protein
MMDGRDALPLQTVLDFLMDRPQLSLGFPAADDKVIGKAANLPGIQQDDIARLPVAGGVDCLAGDLDCFQYKASGAWLSRL